MPYFQDARARLQISSHILDIFDETSMASQHQLKPTTALTDLTNFDQKKESALGVEFGGGKLPSCDARFTHPTMSVKISRVISKRRCFAALVTAGFSRPNYQNRMMIGGARVYLNSSSTLPSVHTCAALRIICSIALALGTSNRSNDSVNEVTRSGSDLTDS